MGGIGAFLREACRIGLVFAAATILCGAILAGLLHAEALARIPVYFYRGLVCLGLAALVTAVLLAPLVRRGWLQMRDLASAAILAAGLNLTAFVLFPVTVDRSISVYLLGVISARPGHVWTAEELTQVFVDGYVGAHGQIERRIAEQTVSGNIETVPGGFVVSDQGARFVAFSRTVAAVFNADDHLLPPAER